MAAAACRSMSEQAAVEFYFRSNGNWAFHDSFPYWTGYTTMDGDVANVTSGVYAAAQWSQTSGPYTHFVHYEYTADVKCVLADQRHAYTMYKSW
jgi:hypothetical protein